MISKTSSTIDHFGKNGQRYTKRWHYEFHFDGQQPLADLAREYSHQFFDRMPDGYFYPVIPTNRLHITVQEALRQDGVPGQYSESHMCDRDEQIQRVLDDREMLELELGQPFLGEDGLLLPVEPHNELCELRNEIRQILGMSLDDGHIPHVTLAYSKRCDDTTEIYRALQNVDIPPAIVSVKGLTRVLQWSNGEYYDWEDKDRKLLAFGGQ